MSKAPILKLRTAPAESVRVDSDISAAPVVTIGGLLTIKQLYPLYAPLLRLDTSSAVPARERFVPPPGRGLGPVEVTRAQTNERVRRIHERTGQKLLLVGHSLGALLATMVAVDNPDIVAGVTCLAGAHEGIRQHTWATRALIRAVGNPPHAALLDHDSSFMAEHRDQVHTAWPVGVPLHVISTVADPLVVPPQGFGLRPNGVGSENRLVIPPGMHHLARRLMQGVAHDVTYVPTLLPIDHNTIPLAPVVLDQVQSLRLSLAGYALEATHAELPEQPPCGEFAAAPAV